MTTEQWKYVFLAVVIFGILALGFFLGRKTVKIPEPRTITEYIQGPTVHDSIPVPYPVSVHDPIDTANIIKQCVKDGIYAELFPEKVITQYIEVSKADTTAIMKDWATTRKYSETLFDIDTLGRCSVDAEVQYNRVRFVSYDYTPVVKHVTEKQYIVKSFSPFVGAGAMINPWDAQMDPMAKVEAGFFIKEKYGLQLEYQHAFSTKNDFVGGSILFKF